MAIEPSSISNLYQDQEEVAKLFGRIVYTIVCHTDFEACDFNEYPLHLCESYCLLWQDAQTGQVDGRLMGVQLKIGVFAALFIDLVAEDKIQVFKTNPEDEPLFSVVEANHSESFLDIAIFNTLLSATSTGRLKEAKIYKWLERAADADLVETTFESLVARGILKEKASGILGICKRFPTVNPEPEQKLEEKIKNIALNDEELDSYMLSLLILSRESDRIFMCSDPILKKHFSSLEYSQAKKRLDRILVKHLKV